MNAMQNSDRGADEMDTLYAGGKEPGDGEGKSIDEENREHMANTAEVPVAVLQGPKGEAVKVGDEVVVKVKAVNGETASVEYSSTKPSEIPAGEDYSKEGADKELDEMNESY